MLTEPGLQVSDFPPMCMNNRLVLSQKIRVCRPRRRMRWLPPLISTLLWAMSCAPTIIATPPAVPRPTPVPVPTAPVDVSPVRYAIPSVVTDTRYRLESVAAFERDSAGRRDTQQQTSRADVMVRMRRSANGALAATGRISGYAVQSALSTVPIAIDSLRFEAVLDGTALRVVLQPPLANECDRPETGALALVRNLLIRVPATIAVGESWRDSTVSVVCRSSVPLIFRNTNTYTVVDAERGRDGMELMIRRTTLSRVEGKTATAWRSIEVSGVGSSALDARLSVFSGAVQRIQESSTLTLTVSDKSTPTLVRTQQVTQRVMLTGRLQDQ